MTTSTVAYRIHLENIYSGLFSLTNEPLTLELDEHFDLFRVRYGDNKSLAITEQNRNMTLRGLVIGGKGTHSDDSSVKITCSVAGKAPYHTEVVPTGGRPMNFLDVLTRAEDAFYD